MKKMNCILILLLLYIVPLYSEEKKHEVDKRKQPSIESTEITPNPVGQGDVFTITIIVDHDNSSEVEFPLENLPEQLQLWRGPYIRSFIDTDKKDESVRKVRITTTFKARNSGRMVLPEFNVIADSKLLKTDPMLLRVGLYKSRKLYIPIEAEWQQGFEEIYTGEAVPVFLMVRNQEAVTFFDRVRVAFPNEGFFEEAAGIGTISTLTAGNVVLFDIPAASYIYTATKPGSVKIPSAGVDYDGITGWTDNLFLEIKDTPESLDTGAVGAFSFESVIDSSRVDSEGEIVLSCRVEGDGNFNYFEMPEPEVSGCILVSKEEINNYKESLFGYSGSRTIVSIYKVDGPGSAEIVVPEFDFLDKKNGIIVTEARKRYSIKVEVEASSEEVNTGASVFEFERMEEDLIAAGIWKNHYTNIKMYIFMLPGLLFFVLCLLFRWRKILLCVILTTIIMVALISAGSLIVPSSQTAVDAAYSNPVRLYNNSIYAYETGDLTGSLHLIRSAVYIDPVNRNYRELLAWLEDENGFINSVSPSIRLHPDIFFYIMVFAVNLLFISIVLRKKESGSIATVFIILAGLMIILSSFMIFYTDLSRSRPAGVCLAGSSLKKIPRESAALWMSLQEGVAVKILDRTDGFMLIETGLGVKGWIDENSVLEDWHGDG
jgi:hypothetical protein